MEEMCTEKEEAKSFVFLVYQLSVGADWHASLANLEFHCCDEYRNVKMLYGREEKRKRRGRVHVGEELASSWTPRYLAFCFSFLFSTALK